METLTHAKVSIFFPVKNTAPYLEECLDSILHQTYSNWELLAVNDNSTDNSLEILQRYAQKDNRVKVFNNPGNGLIEALQLSHSKANGAWYTRMDSDDIMPQNKLEWMIAAAEKGVVVTGKVDYFSQTGNLGDGYQKYTNWLNALVDNNTHWDELYKECVIPSQCWMVNKDDFERIGEFNSRYYPEDYDLCFRMYKHGLKVKPINQVLNHWRDRDDRISRTYDVYKDNRFLKLKMTYFLAMSQNKNVPLALWGAGKNGKDIAKLLIENGKEFNWLCDNPNKVGHNIYGVILEDVDPLLDPSEYTTKELQIIVAVASPEEKAYIKTQLDGLGKKLGKDYWMWV